MKGDRRTDTGTPTRRGVLAACAGLLGVGYTYYLVTRDDENASDTRTRTPEPGGGGFTQTVREDTPVADTDTDEPTSRSRIQPRGPVRRDPDHPQWLKYRDRGLFLCGPGDPEGFLYRGQQNDDGTRDGDQVYLIEKLSRYGGNAIYMHAIRSHGGDGTSDQNPFIDDDPRMGLNDSILSQWESWFTRMERNDIIVYLFVYDDSALVWDTGDAVESPERTFVERLITRFDHHDNIVWNVAEEANEAFSGERVRRLAEVIGEASRDRRLIGSHLHSSLDFWHFEPGSALNHYAMQYTAETSDVHQAAVEARQAAESAAGDGYQVVYVESTESRGNRTSDVRSYIWEIAMGGVMSLRLDMDIATTPPETLQQCRILREFFQSTDYQRMSNHDDLASGDTDYVLADPGRSYILYSKGQGSELGVKDVPPGTYSHKWVDCSRGVTRAFSEHDVATDELRLTRPSSIGGQCAVWVTKTA